MQHGLRDGTIRSSPRRPCGSLPLSFLAGKRWPGSLLKGYRFLHHCHVVFAFTFFFFTCRAALLSSRHFGNFDVDQTLGYPGEGPSEQLTKLISCNVGSMHTNQDWCSWDSQIACLQETRVGKNNFKTSSLAARNTGFHPIFGDLLPGFIQRTGRAQTPCGGVAVLGPPGATKPFDISDDATTIYSCLVKTKRFVCAWVQITPTRRALVCSIYAITGASQDQQAHQENDQLLNDVFTFVSQFGQVPVIIAGDLQANPLSYGAVSKAIHHHNWQGPLHVVDEQGHIIRPFTYSRDSMFSGSREACSSIDAVLLNQQAYFALHSCEVLPVMGRQHRPIQCVFHWPTLSQFGYVHFKAAPLDLSGIRHEPCTVNTGLDQPNSACPNPKWNTEWQNRFHQTNDPDCRWKVVNQFLIEHLLAQGARWGKGPHTRAQAPKFVAKQVCPSQHSNHCAATRQSTVLFKLQSRLNELFIRRTRGPKGDHDWFNYHRTCQKVQQGLLDAKAPVQWVASDRITLVHIQTARSWVLAVIQEHTKTTKHDRIQRWKHRIQQSAQSGCNYIFQHLRNKLTEEPPNLIQDSHGNIIYQPEQVLTCLNECWDSVYGVNTDHAHPLKMLEIIWPYIKHQIHEAELPPIDAHALFQVVQRRKKQAAPGLDGWRTCELQALPCSAFQPVAEFFEWAENQFGDHLPQMLTCTKQMILHKPGPITILPALLLAYTGSRYAQLQSWQQTTMPTEVVGGICGRTMPMLHTALRLDLDEASLQQDELVGIKLDKAKCFDRIIPSHTSALFLAFGLPKHFVNIFSKIYRGLHRHMSYKGWICPHCTNASNGVAQGCSLSLIAVNVQTKVWVHLLQHLPHVTMRAYIDDAYLWCRLIHIAELDHAIQLTKHWDTLSGQKLNDGKSVAWGTTTNARKVIQQTFPDMKQSHTPKGRL